VSIVPLAAGRLSVKTTMFLHPVAVFGYGQSDSEKLSVCGCIFACRSFDGGDLAYPTQHAATATPWTVGRLRPWRMRPVTCSRLFSVVQVPI